MGGERRLPKIVWFCGGPDCDDTAPWTHSFVVQCPNCKMIEHVTRAVRFGNMDSKGE